MPGAIQFECEVSEQGLADFVKALSRYQKETQRDMRDALYSSTVDLIKSLRARTRKAPKMMPLSAFRLAQSDPKYLSKTNYGLIRRVVCKRFAPKKDFVAWVPVHTVYKRRKLKNGGISESWRQESDAQILRHARQEHGTIWNWGLAKKSWGWFMWRLFNLGRGFDNPRVRITHRHVEGGITEMRQPLPDGTIDLEAPIKCEITIINRIRYMRRALFPGALAMAVQKATNSINAKIDKGLKSRRFGT